MRTRPDFIRNHRPKRMLSVFLIAVALVVPFQSSLAAPARTRTESIVLQTAGAPFLRTTAEIVNNEPGNRTAITTKKKGDVRWESKESIQ
jgi:hypothetical protein